MSDDTKPIRITSDAMGGSFRLKPRGQWCVAFRIPIPGTTCIIGDGQTVRCYVDGIERTYIVSDTRQPKGPCGWSLEMNNRPLAVRDAEIRELNAEIARLRAALERVGGMIATAHERVSKPSRRRGDVDIAEMAVRRAYNEITAALATPTKPETP